MTDAELQAIENRRRGRANASCLSLDEIDALLAEVRRLRNENELLGTIAAGYEPKYKALRDANEELQEENTQLRQQLAKHFPPPRMD